MILRVLLVACLLFAPGRFVFGAADAVRVFDSANEAFRAGARSRDSDPTGAHESLGEAIDGYRVLIDELGISNPMLHYNLGNAHLMRGDIGRSIAAYRRALRLTPHDENLRANLAYARSRVRTSFEPGEASRLYHTLFGWQDRIPIRGRLGAFTLLFSLTWIVGMVRLTGPGRRVLSRWVMVGLLVLSLLPAASLGLAVRAEARQQGVLVADSVVGRKGPDQSYEQSFTRALRQGVEFEILETRSEWIYVRLPDGRTTWLTRDSIESV